jgi:inosine-uridine nucleoside N-ribohydrolase
MIDTNHGLTHGMTILDREGLTGRAHNAQVVSRVDPVRFSRLLERAFQVACQITPPSAT